MKCAFCGLDFWTFANPVVDGKLVCTTCYIVNKRTRMGRERDREANNDRR